MACQHPRRRTPPACPDASVGNGLSLKTNMTLRKAATFHSSSTSSSLAAFVPPALGRSQSSLEDVVDAHRRRMAFIVDIFDSSLSLDDDARTPSAPAPLRDESYPVPRGLLPPPVVDPAVVAAAAALKTPTERHIIRPRHRRSSRHHESDSGLGTSLGSTNEKQSAVSISKTATKASAITRSAAASSSTMESLPGLGPKAISRIHQRVLHPLRAKASLKDFESIVLDVPRRIREKEIVCLRDLEKTLIFMAPERAKTANLYLDFCLTSIQCIQATVEYISDREQIRPNDRPYTNGYFIDLVEQIHQYAHQLAAAKEADDMDVDPTDEIKLFGGVSVNGRPAELVRVRKDGKAISMATGLPVDLDDEAKGSPKLKRSLSQQLEDEEEILRSMARRKKNATPEELAPKKCREPGCNKEFKRPCDLTKHEKTHSRPWKCPLTTCKYHEYGWPTEKEMDRHINDKHSAAPAMFECHYKPCPYKSKRESNCKQHMEKAHGWTYVRTKTNGNKSASKAASSTQPTPQLGTMPTPSSSHSIATPPEQHVDQFVSLGSDDNGGIDFPAYMSSEEFNDQYMSMIGEQPALTVEDINLELSPTDHNTPSTDSSYGRYSTYQEGPDFIIHDDIYNAHVQVPPTLWQADGKLMPGLPGFQTVSMCQPHPAQPQVAPHFSPTGQTNAVLFTPNSLGEVDEGFDDFPVTGDDFQLFPNTGLTKEDQFDSLFGEVPSAGLGFSQTNSQVLFPADMDWAHMEYQAYHQQQQ
ncbi:zinc finger transcription factor ace1 [Sodiomyces alkalinus F11]|uniref:Zinc finger transcription factor ace1 n=1 Tax=Sodiomyces alkalinus (strain CBS 110278 / VKM F-3762 / F11) TaxID=1314773 RepID=A0A3N2PZV9_SODAK|nr:zinc finger transcription factor ace1 [Sodiomyces alkalinus F11]ROT40059.1 zinc finger transcription factor ace1 [Sodiomyces alkalinus F11]